MKIDMPLLFPSKPFALPIAPFTTKPKGGVAPLALYHTRRQFAASHIAFVVPMYV